MDRAGTPWLRMFDRAGTRIDEICFPPDYRAMLHWGYREGIIARVFEQHSLLPFYRLGYITAFHDPGLFCPYTVSLATAVSAFVYSTLPARDAITDPACRQRDEKGKTT